MAPSPTSSAQDSAASPAELRIRGIAETDIEPVIDLLTRGFPNSRRFWETGFARLRTRDTPSELPRYGYLLEASGRIVGAILLISSLRHAGGEKRLFSNLSSWYVEPAYRSHAPQLLRRALTNKQTTYLSISIAEHVRQIYEAFGFKRYADGQVLALAALARNRIGGDTRVLGIERINEWNIGDDERRLIELQASYGCIALCYVTDGQSRPFVFLPRIIKRFIPCAHLVYCRSIADLSDIAGSVGRYLMRRGRPFMLVDANGPIPGMPGKYFPGATPKYVKGPAPAVLGDIAETEATIFGIWSPTTDR